MSASTEASLSGNDAQPFINSTLSQRSESYYFPMEVAPKGISYFHSAYRSQLTFKRLNLEAATHVHLLEPHWNPMVEAQAAARVDRLDQVNNIYIHRYIVKDSIEEVRLDNLF